MKKLWEKMREMRLFPLWLAGGALALLLLLWPGENLSAAGLTQEESRISRMLSAMAGAGETRIILHYGGEESLLSQQRHPEGALILSRGAGDPAVRLQLLQAVETLLGLPASRVEIFLMEGP